MIINDSDFKETELRELEKIETLLEEIIDLEEHALAGKAPPEAKQYRIRVDKEHIVVDVPEMTGREILEKAGRNPPEKYALYEKTRGCKRERIQLDQVVSFRKHGVERFSTLPLDQTEGA